MAASRAATQKVLGLLTAPATGLPYTVSAIARQEQAPTAAIEAGQIVTQNVAYELVERTAGVKYPAVYVYCEGLTNSLKEKFRTFSGQAHMAIEARISHEHLERLAGDLQVYASATTEVLDKSRGDWGSGMFYTGGYKVEFGPVKRGGRNFVQTVKVSFDVEVSY
jgi:hypothetical protein